MEYKIRRTNYNNDYPKSDMIFQSFVDFKKLLTEKNTDYIFKPVILPVISHNHFQVFLSNVIDTLDLLPLRPDLGFDIIWRTIDAYMDYYAKKRSWNIKKSHKILNKTSDEIFLNLINANPQILSNFTNLMRSIPLQSTEFIAKRIFDISRTAVNQNQQKYIKERVKDSIGDDLYDEIEKKFTPLTPENQRNCGLLLQKLLNGEEIELNSNKFTLNNLGKLKLIVGGLLYSYRNERFHGDTFSPFRSSMSKLKTFAHSYYCFITAYNLLTYMIIEEFQNLLNVPDVITRLDDNINRFYKVFDVKLND